MKKGGFFTGVGILLITVAGLLMWEAPDTNPLAASKPPASSSQKKKGALPPGKKEALPLFKEPFSGIAFHRPPGWKVEIDPSLGMLVVAEDRSLRTTAFFWPLVMEKDSQKIKTYADALESVLGELFRNFKVLERRATKEGGALYSVRYSFEYSQKYSGLMIYSKIGDAIVATGYSAPEKELAKKEKTLLSIIRSFQIYKHPEPTGVNAAGKYFIRIPKKGWRVETIDANNIAVWGDTDGLYAGIVGGSIPENPQFAMTGPKGIASPYLSPEDFMTRLAPTLFDGVSSVEILGRAPLSEFDRFGFEQMNIEKLKYEAEYLDTRSQYKGVNCRGSYLVFTLPSTEVGYMTGAPYWTFIVIGGGAPEKEYERWEGTLSAIINSTKVNWELSRRLNDMELKMRQEEMQSNFETWRRQAELLGGLERLHDPATGKSWLEPWGPLGTYPWTKDGSKVIWSSQSPGPGYRQVETE